jgi:hypothetical protein
MILEAEFMPELLTLRGGGYGIIFAPILGDERIAERREDDVPA